MKSKINAVNFKRKNKKLAILIKIKIKKNRLFHLLKMIRQNWNNKLTINNKI
jgi:hypothetical protein